MFGHVYVVPWMSLQVNFYGSNDYVYQIKEHFNPLEHTVKYIIIMQIYGMSIAPDLFLIPKYKMLLTLKVLNF